MLPSIVRKEEIFIHAVTHGRSWRAWRPFWRYNYWILKDMIWAYAEVDRKKKLTMHFILKAWLATWLVGLWALEKQIRGHWYVRGFMINKEWHQWRVVAYNRSIVLRCALSCYISTLTDWNEPIISCQTPRGTRDLTIASTKSMHNSMQPILSF